jgi:hypothetical protein
LRPWYSRNARPFLGFAPTFLSGHRTSGLINSLKCHGD